MNQVLKIVFFSTGAFMVLFSGKLQAEKTTSPQNILFIAIDDLNESFTYHRRHHGEANGPFHLRSPSIWSSLGTNGTTSAGQAARIRAFCFRAGRETSRRTAHENPLRGSDASVT